MRADVGVVHAGVVRARGSRACGSRARGLRAVALAGAALGLLLAGCSTDPARPSDGAGAVVPALAGPSPPAPVPAEIPGLGPRTRALIHPGTRQALVVTGRGEDSSHATVVLYERNPVGVGARSGSGSGSGTGSGTGSVAAKSTGATVSTTPGWRSVSTVWTARNGRRGWTEHHRMGDLRSPAGVFTLTDAGGRLHDPGTRLPYDQGRAFRASGTNVEGESLREAFDYVVAVDYNRVPGRTPLDWTRPLGAERGGGIWVHVDHGAGTAGCVGVGKPQMRELLRRLDPAARPVVVMGPEEWLGR
ncbi:L,D-transpeptidase family protein [Streptomyces sp. NPDC057638]|uniref:L,D-transpeptidase family protein n=1 Tax=Streptomyces sp. NPDC057638 TaxID=3346190 RepID=UPI0036AFCD10